MKSLQILPSLEVGGVERGVIDLARALKRRGEEMVVISSGGRLTQELQKIGVTHYELPVHRKSFFSLELVPKIVEIIEREHIDIVHARSRVPGWLAWLAARKTGRPFVTTCHGYYSTHLLSRVMGWGKRVIVISRVVGRHMIDDFGVSPDRIRLIHRGVDLSQFSFSPKKDRDPQKPFRIINVGRLSPIKGQIEFLRAIHRVRREIPRLEVLLVGAEGKAKHKYTDRILETLKQLDLESTVQLMGTRRDVPELIASSDLLVLSTLVPEAFGRVIVEAGAVGTPVISTAVGGVFDIIEPGQNGLLVPAGDSESMASTILSLLKDPLRGALMAEKLHEKVKREFSLEKMADQTLAVYREVEAVKKILVIKLGAVGDLILAIPSFRMIRERFPKGKISLLVDKKLVSLVALCPYLDEIIPVDRLRLSNPSYLLKTARKIRREGFDLSADFQNSKWTHALAFAAGIPERFGFARGFFGFLLNRPEKNYKVAEPPVRNQFRILSKLGVRKLEESLELWPDPEAEERVNRFLGTAGEEDGRPRVGLVIGSSPQWATKRWPLSYFSELAGRLVRENCRVVLIGSGEDSKWVNDSDFSKLEGVINLVGKTSLRDLTALMKRMEVLVTGDTAPLHVAGAVRTKLVAIFGPTDPKRHMPPAPGAIVLTRRLPCQPCYKGVCQNAENLACLQRISVEEVFGAVKKQLALSISVS